MSRPTLRLLITFCLLGLSTTADAQSRRGGEADRGAVEKKGDDNRKDWIKKYDHNKDGDWRGGLFGHKDIRKFKKAHPQPYEKLVKWCEKASEKPNKHDVNLPKDDKKAKKLKCKKGKVDGPYLKAWARSAGEKKSEEKSEGGGRRSPR